MINDNYVPLNQLGNGVTTAFSGSWNVLNASYIRVYFEDTTTGVQTLQTTGWSLVFSDSGVTVTFVSAPPSTVRVIIGRVVALIQSQPYRTSRGWQGQTVENSLDKIVAMVQDIGEQVDRALVFPLGDSTSPVLPSATLRASKTFIFDSAGNASVGSVTGSVVSLAMEPVISASTLAVGRTTLGAAALGANSDITSLSALTSINGGPLAGFRNRVINGAMQISQRFLANSQTFVAGAALAYCVDRFYGFCTGANITGAQISSLGLTRYRFTGATSNTGVGFGTRLEAANTADLASGNGSGTACFSLKLSSSSLTSIGWAVYYANTTDAFGTLASPTRTLISSGTFTINSTEAVYSAPINSIPSAAITGLELVLTGGPLLAAQTLTIGDIQLETGTIATTFERRGTGIELALCQRYYEKSFLQTVAPAQNAGASNATAAVVAIAGATIQSLPIQFKVTKRLTPTITTFNPSAANAQPRNFDASVDLSGVTAYNTGQDIYTMTATGNAVGTVGQRVLFHWTADAEL